MPHKYATQTAWTAKDMQTLRPYLSDRLYENWKSKVDWMDIRKERNVLENIQLLSRSVVGLYDARDNEHDLVWFFIEGKMIDYMVNEETGLVEESDQKAHPFVEYWKLIRHVDTFYLDEIAQKDELKVDHFLNFSEELGNENNGDRLRHPS